MSDQMLLEQEKLVDVPVEASEDQPEETDSKPVEEFQLAYPTPMFTEASGIAFTKLYGLKDGQVIEINVTARANNAKDAIEQLMDAAKFGKSIYHLSLTNPRVSSSPPQQPKSETTNAPSAPAKSNNTPTQTNQAASSPKNPTQSADNGASLNSGIFHTVKLEIVPEAEGKVTLKWYAAGRKFPEIYTKRTIQSAVEMLCLTGEGWTADHLARASEFNVHHDVYWRESEKTNQKGNHYKDIFDLRSA